MSDPSPSDPEPRQTKPGSKSLFARLTAFMRPVEPEDREDIREFLDAAHEKKVLDSEVYTMLSGALNVANQTVADIMVPRSKMDMLDISRPLAEVLPEIIETGHSRFPVYEDDRDNIVGILLAKDLLLSISNPQLDLRPLVRPAVFIPETKRLNVLLRDFRSSRNHLAIVIDEHGGTAGLVTMEDVLEQIVGEIDDEHDDADEAKLIAAQADGQFMVDALTPIGDFNEQFGADFPDDEYDTIGGLVTAAIGHLPEAGEELALGRFHFRVGRADRRRVHTFVVSVHAEA